MVSTAVHPINHSTHPWKFRAKDGLPKNTLLLRTPSGAVISAVAGGVHFIPYAKKNLLISPLPSWFTEDQCLQAEAIPWLPI